MYETMRKVLFALDGEAAHDIALRALKAGHALGLNKLFAGPALEKPVTVMGLKLPNPVGLAAGMDKNGECIDAFADLGFGFLEVGTVTPLPQPGNPKPRLFRAEPQRAIVNRMGFNNDGAEKLAQNVRSASYKGVLGINIGKNAATPIEDALSDYLKCMDAVYALASYITVNISSPNTKNLRDLQQASRLASLLGALKARQSKLADETGRRVPIAVKIAPDVADADIPAMAAAICESGVEGVIATNTTIDKTALGDSPLAGEPGGMSGAPLRERADETLSLFAKELKGGPDLIGVGGIFSAADAKRKIELGAKAVQIFTSLVYNGPNGVRRLVEEM